MNRKIRMIGLSLLVIISSLAMVLLSAATSLAADAPILKSLSVSERARVEKLIAGAKKEGELVYVGQVMPPDVAFSLFDDFKVQYGLPNLQLKHTMKRSTGVISTVRNDISAGRNTFDVINTGAVVFLRKLLRDKAIMKYESPNYSNFIPELTGEKKGAFAVPGYFISSFVSSHAIVYNPKYVKKELKTWDDVLDPKFKGKIIVADVLKSGTMVNVYGGLRKVLPRSFWEKLAKQDPIFVLSHRSHVRKVVAGEKWISVITATWLAYRSALKGVDIRTVTPKGGSVAMGYPFAILAKAPHPNAAKLWIDYLHSRRGHMKFLNMHGFASGIKNAAPSPKLAKFVVPLEKLDIIPMEWEKIGPKQVKEWRAEWREIFYGNK